MSVVDELFNIFTHYALIGDPHDPEHIKATHFQKFARDCQMLPTPAIQQKLHILFKHLLAKQARKREGDGAPESPRASPVARPAPLRSPSRRLSMSEKAAAATAAANESRAQQAASASALSLTRLDFHGFLDLLMAIAPEVYPTTAAAPGAAEGEGGGGAPLYAGYTAGAFPRSPGGTPGIAAKAARGGPDAEASALAFQRLLMENVLPLAARREPNDVAAEPETRAVLKTFAGGLTDVFRYYAALSDRKRKLGAATARAAAKAAKGSVGAHGQITVTKRGEAATDLSHVSYAEWMTFCTDFQIFASALLTTVQAGDIFLSTVAEEPRRAAAQAAAKGGAAPDAGGDAFGVRALGSGARFVADLTLAGFKRALLRAALCAFGDADARIAPERKLKALFLFMWKSITRPEIMKRAVVNNEKRDVVKVKGGDLNVCGSGAFNEVFYREWQKDRCADYLEPPPEPDHGGGTTLLRTLVAAPAPSPGGGAAPAKPPPPPPPAKTALAEPKSTRLKASDVQALLQARPDLLEVLRIELGAPQAE